jgi:hypothetical protein
MDSLTVSRRYRHRYFLEFVTYVMLPRGCATESTRKLAGTRNRKAVTRTT